MPPRKKKAKTLTPKEQRLRDAKWKGYGDAIKDAQGGVASSKPTNPKDVRQWDWSNRELFTGDEISLEGLGIRKDFVAAGGKGSSKAREELWKYMREKIEAAAAARLLRRARLPPRARLLHAGRVEKVRHVRVPE